MIYTLKRNKDIITLGYTGRINNYTLADRKKFRFVEAEAVVVGNELVYNFDYYIISNRSKRNDTIVEVMESAGDGDFIIGGTGSNKKIQNIILTRLGINTPKMYGAFQLSGVKDKMDMFGLLSGINPNSEIVIKPDLGCLGREQILVDSRVITAISRHNQDDIINRTTSSTSEITPDENLPIDSAMVGNSKDTVLVNDDETKSVTLRSYDLSEYEKFHISERIHVKDEYRVILFATGKYIIHKRIQSEYNDWQMVTDLQHDITLNEMDDIFAKIDIDCCLSDMRTHMLNENFPMLSIDVYIDDDDNVGIFEFQEEFGITNHWRHSRELGEMVTGALEFTIERISHGE